MLRRWFRYAILVCLLLPLAGCYLVSGERERLATPVRDGVGEIAVQFVSADGRTQSEYVIGPPVSPVILDATVSAERGDLTLEFLDSNLATVLVVSGRYGLSGKDSIMVQTDGGGRIKFRVIANEVRNGAYTIRYRFPQPEPTPTPTPTPTPSPSPEPTP
jgi:hypothetical protein